MQTNLGNIEEKVFEMLAEGMTNQEIADRLETTLCAVHHAVSRLCKKFDCDGWGSRTKVAVIAYMEKYGNQRRHTYTDLRMGEQ